MSELADKTSAMNNTIGVCYYCFSPEEHKNLKKTDERPQEIG